MSPKRPQRTPRPLPQRSPARVAALRALVDIESTEVKSAEALRHHLDGLRVADRRDRALATELVYGVLRRRNRLDFALSRFASRPLSALPPLVLIALRMGAYQLLELDRIPDHAAIWETVDAVRRSKDGRLSGLANALLRKVQRHRDDLSPPAPVDSEGLSVAGNIPRWLAQRWLDAHGPEASMQLANAYASAAPPVVRLYGGDDGRKAVFGWADEVGVELRDGGLPQAVHLPRGVDAILAPPFAEGHWMPQDEGSQLVVETAGLQPGQRVLDACAGTGTKTIQIAEAVGPKGRVVALDVEKAKIAANQKLVERFGVSATVDFRIADASDGAALAAANSEPFDVVIVDAPCSGLGSMRRRPEIRWRRTPADVRQLASLQLRILDATSKWVADGGLLVYAVCTFTPEESEGVVQRWLERAGDSFALEPATASEPYLRTGPLLDGRDGFFIARLRRASKPVEPTTDASPHSEDAP